MAIQAFSARTISAAFLITILSACSNGTTPVPGVASANASAARPATSCPSGGITFAPGNNGTYSVGVGDSCVLYGPSNQTCLIGELAGYQYNFFIVSGSNFGTLSSTTQSGAGSKATFKRTSSGDVLIYLKQLYFDPVDNCKTAGDSTYGYVTLD